MIVVTGQGRSGTSLVAQVYRELGFETGGVWHPESNAGFEDEEVVRANGAILSELDVSVQADVATSLRNERHIPELPFTRRLASRARYPLTVALLRVLGHRDDQLNLMPWERFDELVSKHRSRLVELATERPLVKDPRFCWTMGFWLAAGAPIEHVLVCTRNTDAMVDSRNAARMITFKSRGAARNSMIYSLGLLLSWLYDYRVDHAVVRFPDFLDDPARLYAAMRFPEPVSSETFTEAWRRVVRKDMVHDSR